MDGHDAALILESWAGAHRRPPRKRVRWEALDALRVAAATKRRVEATALGACLSRSREHLRPFADPLQDDWGSHRWMRVGREEHYSDWLAWLVERLGQAQRVLRLFEVDQDAIDGCAGITPAIDRELSVPEGNAGHGGRLDLVVRYPGSLSWSSR